MNHTITNDKKFANVLDLEIQIDTFTNHEMTSFYGAVIITTEEGELNIQGEHGLNDYKDRFGFVINNGVL